MVQIKLIIVINFWEQFIWPHRQIHIDMESVACIDACSKTACAQFRQLIGCPSKCEEKNKNKRKTKNCISDKRNVGKGEVIIILIFRLCVYIDCEQRSVSCAELGACPSAHLLDLPPFIACTVRIMINANFDRIQSYRISLEAVKATQMNNMENICAIRYIRNIPLRRRPFDMGLWNKFHLICDLANNQFNCSYL